jgi:hypothetical protein
MPLPDEGKVASHLGQKAVQSLTGGGTKWTTTRWARICQCAWLGMSYSESAILASIARVTLEGWRKLELPDGRTLQDDWDYWVSEGTLCLARKCHTVAELAEDDATMALKLLERRSASFRPPPKQVEISGGTQAPTIRLIRGDGTTPAIPGLEEA